MIYKKQKSTYHFSLLRAALTKLSELSQMVLRNRRNLNVKMIYTSAVINHFEAPSSKLQKKKRVFF